eukprot:5560401-Amphidinium_carterae.3
MSEVAMGGFVHLHRALQASLCRHGCDRCDAHPGTLTRGLMGYGYENVYDDMTQRWSYEHRFLHASGSGPGCTS